jgi:hypothetical protein
MVPKCLFPFWCGKQIAIPVCSLLLFFCGLQPLSLLPCPYMHHSYQTLELIVATATPVPALLLLHHR